MKKIIKKLGLLLMSVILLFITVTLLFYHLPLKRPEIKPHTGDVLIANIHVVDVEHERIRLNQNVVISAGKIEKISASSEPGDYSRHRLIDGRGKYLMPGLWDMHTHSLKISPYIHHPLFIRYGVTSVRDMSGCLDQNDTYWACPEDRKKWTQLSEAGEAVSPTYHRQSSYQTNGGNEVPDGFAEYFRLNTRSDAAQLVGFYVGQGVDFIKTYTELSADQFKWLAQESTKQGIKLAGHKPLKVSLVQALANNITSLEHGRLFAFECYAGIASFRALPDPVSSYTPDLIRDIINNQDPQKCDQLMRLMGQSQTAWVPTLTTLKMSAQSRHNPFNGHPSFDYIPTVVKTLMWEPDVNRAATKGFDKDGRFVHMDYYQLAKAQIKKAHRHQMRILVGTDNIDTLVFSGLSVHHELQNLVEAGLTPGKALLAATLWPAQFSGVESITGTVEEGKRADLIILHDNPLEHIENTQSIEAVLFNGLYFDSEAIAELEKYVVDMAQSIHLNTKLLMQMLMSPLMRTQLAD